MLVLPEISTFFTATRRSFIGMYFIRDPDYVPLAEQVRSLVTDLVQPDGTNKRYRRIPLKLTPAVAKRLFELFYKDIDKVGTGP